MLTFRFLAGLFASSSINNGPASIADVRLDSRAAGSALTIRPGHDRHPARSVHALLRHRGLWRTLSVRSALGSRRSSAERRRSGPVCGGFIQAYAPTWRWNLHVCSIFVGSATILAFVALDETHHPTIIARRNARQSGAAVKRKSFREVATIFRIAIARPAQILFTGASYNPSLGAARLKVSAEPIAALVSLYLSILYAVLYGFFALFPIVYEWVTARAASGRRQLT